MTRAIWTNARRKAEDANNLVNHICFDCCSQSVGVLKADVHETKDAPKANRERGKHKPRRSIARSARETGRKRIRQTEKARNSALVDDIVIKAIAMIVATSQTVGGRLVEIALVRLFSRREFSCGMARHGTARHGTARHFSCGANPTPHIHICFDACRRAAAAAAAAANGSLCGPCSRPRPCPCSQPPHFDSDQAYRDEDAAHDVAQIERRSQH